MVSSHDFVDDKRNKNIKIYINGKFYKRKDAKISVFDSSTILGDGIWDSLRYHNDNFIFLKEHLDRLYKDAKLIDLKIHLTRKKLSEALIKTIQINKMKTDVHLRIIVSRGIKSTPYQSPKVTISKPTIIIIPEYKKPDIKAYKKGLKLVTVKTIRGPINVQNPQINSLSKLNCILACIEANKKNADEALMFDINGNVATNNSTHFFFVKNNTVFTSTGKYCVTGITRQKIIDLCKKNKVKVKEKNFKLNEVLNADEAFCTGSFAGIVPVNQINKKKYSLKKNPITKELTNIYNNLF
ncbi:aminotransferase class IV [Pelagibacteraceae bacterium]|nr:aminotransferase class IV [Pelagibacteraceae bacterium]